MGGQRPPTPPDPQKTAQAQTGTNVATAIANQVLGHTNQTTPYGSLSYDQTGTFQWTDPSGKNPKTYDIPTFTANQDLSKHGRKLQNLNSEAEINLARLGRDQSGRLGDVLGKPMNFNGAPDVKAPNLATSFGRGGEITDSYSTDFSKDRNRVERALMERMNPGLEQGRERLESQLTNQGLQRGSAAWDQGLREYGTQENDARLGAILAGGQEQSRMVGLERDRAVFGNQAQAQRSGQNLAQAQFGNQARQQSFGNDQSLRSNWMNEQYAQRSQPINEISALLGTGQVTQPNFVNTPQTQMPTVDYAGLVSQNYDQRLAQYEQSSGMNPWLQAGFGVAKAGIAASDRRLKTDVERVGEWRGFPLYAYRYIWGGAMRLGVMAQDVVRSRPDAIVPIFGDYMAVDYAKLSEA